MKIQSHTIVDGKSPLHRAFSLFHFNSSNIIIDGLTFRVGEINFNGVSDTTLTNSKLLYSGHNSHMIINTETGEHNKYSRGGFVNTQSNIVGYGGDDGARRGLGHEQDRH